MKTTPNRDLLVLFKNNFMSQLAMEQEVECLTKILRQSEHVYAFCTAYELVCRNRISQKTQKLMAAARQPQLKPFWFLIGKN